MEAEGIRATVSCQRSAGSRGGVVHFQKLEETKEYDRRSMAVHFDSDVTFLWVEGE